MDLRTYQTLSFPQTTAKDIQAKTAEANSSAPQSAQSLNTSRCVLPQPPTPPVYGPIPGYPNSFLPPYPTQVGLSQTIHMLQNLLATISQLLQSFFRPQKPNQGPILTIPETRRGVAPDLTQLVGLSVNQAMIAAQSQGLRNIRVIRPGQVVTAEYNDKRLTLLVDDANKVTSAKMG